MEEHTLRELKCAVVNDLFQECVICENSQKINTFLLSLVVIEENGNGSTALHL